MPPAPGGPEIATREPFAYGNRLELRGRGQPLGRIHRRQIREERALLRRLGVTAVDRLDPHERGMALVAARGSQRSSHLVPGPQLAAPDLGGRDVHIVAVLHAQEPASGLEHVENSGHRWGVGLAGRIVGGLGRCLIRGLCLVRRRRWRILSGRLGRLLVRCACALSPHDGGDQVRPAKRAVALDPELGRDRVKIGERALLELLALEN